jgi:hypothetical protein
MKLPLFVACLVAGSTWSFAYANASASTDNPKTAQKQYSTPSTHITPADKAAAKDAPTTIPYGLEDEDVNYQAPTTQGTTTSGKAGRSSTSTTAPAGGILGVSAAPPAEDACATPMVIATVSGSNLFAFDTTLATTGPEAQSAATFGCNSQTYGNAWDIWFEWTSPWSAFATVRTCGQTAMDSKLVMWTGAGCPTAGFLACSNNSAACSPQSQLLNVWVTSGTTYMIQLGSSMPGGVPQPAGTGNLEIIQFQPPPAPPNDPCAGALSIVGAGPFFWDNTGATDDPGMPAAWCGTQWGHDMWYEWQAGFTGICQAQTCNGTATFDTMLMVYPGNAVAGAGLCPGMNPELACNDDGCGPAGPSQLQFACTAGNYYVVRVGGWNHENNAGGVLEMLDATNPLPGDNCATPDVAFVGANFYNTIAATTGAQGQAEAACLFGGSTAIERDAWYTWTDGGGGGCTKITNCGGFHDSKIAVYAGVGCPGAGALVCNDDACGVGNSAVAFNAAPGGTYTIQIGSFTGVLGASSILTIAQYPAGPGNDECSAPVIAITGANAYDNSTATTGCDGQSEVLCGQENGLGNIDNDLWFTWTAPAAPTSGLNTPFYASVTTCGLSLDDTKLAVYAGAGCPSGAAIACRDDSCGTGQSTAIFQYTPGAAYSIQVGNFPGSPGSAGNFFQIALVTHPAACAPWDDGTTDLAVGAFGPNDYAWMNRFGEPNVTVTINSVDVAYGVAFIPLGVPNGTLTDIFVWQDGMSQDGDPIDAQLIWTEANVAMANVSTDILNNYPLGAAQTITGIFFVGTHCYNVNGIIPNVSGYTLPYDRTIHDWINTSWMYRADGVGPGLLDNANLANNTVPVHSAESSGYFGQHPIRVNCTQGPTNTCCRPGVGVTLACPCTNPPGALGRGCNNKDATGGARLGVLSGSPVITAPLATSLVFQDVGQNSIGSAVSILMQGKALTNGQVFGHGVRCFGAFLRLYNHSTAPWIAPGSGIFTAPIAPDLTIPARSAAAGQPIVPGAPRFYQVYYRDNVNMLPALTCSIASSKQNISQGEWCFWN